MRGFLLGAIALLGLVSAASAADIAAYGPLYKTAPVANFGWETEFGGRYWYSSGKTQWDLFGIPPTVQNSRLTFSDLTGHAGELYGRLDHSSGLFVKGYAGLGTLVGGKLQDEDFPPFTPIYSSTDSDQRVGNFGYLTADLGWAFWTTPFVRVGAFVGYHYYSEKVNVYGCSQTVGGEFCVPTVPTSVLLITQESNWNAARVGINGVWRITERLKLTADAAWVPYASLSAKDFHWTRINTGVRGDFNGPTPQDGTGHGVQLEAILSYNFTRAWSVGIGGRYWRLETKNHGGTWHFEESAIGGGVPQEMTFKTERYGGFVQASYIFGAPILSANY